MATNRKTRKYQATRFACSECKWTRSTATALDYLKCRETEGCTGHYVRESK